MKEKYFALFILDLNMIGYRNTEYGFTVDEEFFEDLIEFNQITYEENIEKIKLLFDVEEEKLEDEEIGYKVSFDVNVDSLKRTSEILSKANTSLGLTKFLNTFDPKELQSIADYTSDFYQFLIFKESDLEESLQSPNGLYKYLKQ